MDKGIFYLLCSLVLGVFIVLSGVATTNKVAQICTGKTTVVVATPTVEPSPSLSPTASPAGALKTVKPATTSGAKSLVK